MDSAKYTQLKDELENDSKNLAYAGKSSAEIAQMLNTPGLSEEQIDNSRITADDVFAALDMTEFAGANQEQKDYINLVVALGEINPKKALANIRATIQAIFADMPNTCQNLLGLTYKPASRAEVLGFGTVEPWDVERAIERTVM